MTTFRLLGALLLIFSLAGCGSLSNGAQAPDDQLAQYYSGKARRWRFCDDSIEDERLAKTRTMSRIKDFWRRLELDSPILLKEFDEGKTSIFDNWTETNLQPIDPHLMWEFGCSRDDKEIMQFCVTAEEHAELKPIVETIVSGAPKISRLSLVAGRRSLSPENVEMAFRARTAILDSGEKKIPRFRTKVHANSSNTIDVDFYSPDFKSEDSEQDLGDCLLICDLVLGEEDLDKWLGVMRSYPLPQGDKETVLSTEVESNRFFEEFAAAKAKLIAGLPEESAYHLRDDGFLVSSDEGSARMPGRITMSVSNKGLGQAMFGNLSFYSERFSRNGEKFCFLIGRGLGSGAEPKNREVFERGVDSLLRNEKLGLLVGAGFGDGGDLYLDLCLADVDRAIPLLRKFATEHRLPRESYLRFYDADWCHEWVGMYPDSPVPVEFR
ncbi:MAG: hypothetical protein AB7V06_17865 [Candidatus Obscuribacterales bacterium]